MYVSGVRALHAHITSAKYWVTISEKYWACQKVQDKRFALSNRTPRRIIRVCSQKTSRLLKPVNRISISFACCFTKPTLTRLDQTITWIASIRFRFIVNSSLNSRSRIVQPKKVECHWITEFEKNSKKWAFLRKVTSKSVINIEMRFHPTKHNDLLNTKHSYALSNKLPGNQRRERKRNRIKLNSWSQRVRHNLCSSEARQTKNPKTIWIGTENERKRKETTFRLKMLKWKPILRRGTADVDEHKRISSWWTCTLNTPVRWSVVRAIMA